MFKNLLIVKIFVATISPFLIIYVAVRIKENICPIKQHTGKIVEVGGCNRFGVCGAITDNGDKIILNLPVKGETVKYETDACLK